MTSKPGSGVVMLTNVKRKGPLGPMTLAFFRKGDDLEATDFENLPYNDPALVPPKLPFRSFSRVPRRRLPLVMAFLAVVAIFLSVAGWSRVQRETARVAPIAWATVSSGWIHLKNLAAQRGR